MENTISRRPRSGRIADAIAYSGLGRTRLYEEAAKRRGLFRKNGTATIVDFDVLDEIIAALPAANIRPDYGVRRSKQSTPESITP